jgi:hypothetical protein
MCNCNLIDIISRKRAYIFNSIPRNLGPSMYVIGGVMDMIPIIPRYVPFFSGDPSVLTSPRTNLKRPPVETSNKGHALPGIRLLSCFLTHLEIVKKKKNGKSRCNCTNVDSNYILLAVTIVDWIICVPLSGFSINNCLKCSPKLQH